MLGMFDTNKNLGGVWARLDGRVFSGVRHCLAHKRVPPCGQAVGTGADADLTIIQVDNNYDPITMQHFRPWGGGGGGGGGA